ncbi:aminopeptidase, putative [Entamoeba nuttalli P19]|uniref:Aminopeptidase, putative n=2 Tax=Entamoeba nuttalli TaxID=412467 RepID=K2HEB3_ENTNP|nr:aminopeptidase, putative [Entamoeba nuttalli P19]EKE41084.1 aminopeptidase, putative [Entamoeba nuttalli P19]|eukprot:XP_008856591.1 aminopeptidase, putative [Entamoeba nuttalli P19]
MEVFHERLLCFREKMKEKGITHYFSKLSDPHMTEYVHPYYKHIEWLCGFTGSNATIVVSHDVAALWTDARYYIQAEKELPKEWTLMRQSDLGTITPTQFILNDGNEFLVGFNPLITSFPMLGQMFDNDNNKLLEFDIFNELQQQELVLAKVEEFTASGLTVKEKLELVRNEYHLGTLILTALDDIAWLFNIRGTDISFSPVAYAYAILNPNGSFLFTGNELETKEIQEFKQLKEAGVTVLPYNSFFQLLEKFMFGPTIYYSEPFTNLELLDRIYDYEEGAELIQKLDFIQITKSIRSPKEIENMKQLHIIDSIALCKFFATMESKKGTQMTEWDACELLEEVRSKNYQLYNGPSFESIIATGANAAIIHYSPTKEKSSIIDWNKSLLCDIGSQYKEGCTTDVTRTVHYGEPDSKVKECYTRVLQGHIDLHNKTFTKDTKIRDLDHFARDPIIAGNPQWNYRHGTGHGVGYYLLVHECPPHFNNDFPFQVGMTTSIEPGIYIENEFGIRIENVVVVVEEDQNHLKFEPFTLVPYCSRLIDISLLTKDEKIWLNKFNASIRSKILPQIKDELTQKWIIENTPTYELKEYEN